MAGHISVVRHPALSVRPLIGGGALATAVAVWLLVPHPLFPWEAFAIPILALAGLLGIGLISHLGVARLLSLTVLAVLLADTMILVVAAIVGMFRDQLELRVLPSFAILAAAGVAMWGIWEPAWALRRPVRSLQRLAAVLFAPTLIVLGWILVQAAETILWGGHDRGWGVMLGTPVLVVAIFVSAAFFALTTGRGWGPVAAAAVALPLLALAVFATTQYISGQRASLEFTGLAASAVTLAMLLAVLAVDRIMHPH